MKKQKKLDPTEAQFMSLNKAYKYFNKALFGGELPACILNFSRKRNTHGFLAPNRWRKVRSKEYSTHEISLTPTTLYREPLLVFSTLVHEQVHLWQFEFGKPSRNGYHNKEWAEKMISVGLMPSDTGKEGGKITGQNMTHYLIKNGAYEKAFKKMPKEFKLPFTSLDADLMKAYTSGIDPFSGKLAIGKGGRGVNTPPSKNKKTKYSCTNCNINVWGKPNLNIVCGECAVTFVVI